MGAGLGFLMGIASTVFSLFQFDDTQIGAGELIMWGLLIGLPFSVLIGLAIGGLWSRFMGPNSL